MVADIDSKNKFTCGNEVINVLPCSMAFATDCGVLRSVVGSGISVCIFDRLRQTAGMNHFIFPRTDDPQTATGKFGNSSLLGLYKILKAKCNRFSPVAYIAGGAYCDEFEIDSAMENIRITWKFLAIKNIPIISQSIGGYIQREITFDIQRGTYKVSKLPLQKYYPFQ